MTAPVPSNAPAPYMPDEEVQLVKETYLKAKVILEYGSGGTTHIAASMRNKLVISVESDAEWARKLQSQLDKKHTNSPAIVCHTDIGETTLWGRPIHESDWRKFFRYPLDVWNKPYFRHPDVILIDGRLRSACLATAIMSCTRPITVLFDDYTLRPLYHILEEVTQPTQIVGRMAKFEISPELNNQENFALLIKQFATASIGKPGEAFYHDLKAGDFL